MKSIRSVGLLIASFVLIASVTIGCIASPVNYRMASCPVGNADNPQIRAYAAMIKSLDKLDGWSIEAMGVKHKWIVAKVCSHRRGCYYLRISADKSGLLTVSEMEEMPISPYHTDLVRKYIARLEKFYKRMKCHSEDDLRVEIERYRIAE